MAGYHLIEERMMKPFNPDGIEARIPIRRVFSIIFASFDKIRFLSRKVTS